MDRQFDSRSTNSRPTSRKYISSRDKLTSSVQNIPNANDYGYQREEGLDDIRFDLGRINLTGIDSASIYEVSQYIELLYEDVPDKIRATRSLLQLALNHDNLDALVGNETLIPALSRTLREDTKRSMELCSTILSIFHQMCTYPVYRPILSTNKVGDLCIRQLEMELKRLDLLQADTGDRKLNVGSILSRQDSILNSSIHILLQLAEDTTIQIKIVKRGILKLLVNLLKTRWPTTHPGVILVMLQFLILLAQYRENIDFFIDQDIPRNELFHTLLELVHSNRPNSKNVQSDTIRLILNLSHDPICRDEFIKLGVIPRIIDLLMSNKNTSASGQTEIIQVLYQFSCDEKTRIIFACTEVIPVIRNMIIISPENQHVPSDLISLAINLALNESNAEKLADNNGLYQFVQRLKLTRDQLMVKLIRNMSIHSSLHVQFIEHIDTIMTMTFINPPKPDLQHQHHPMVVDVIGILANLRIADLDYVKLNATYPNLMTTIIDSLAGIQSSDRFIFARTTEIKGSMQDDLVLESIRLVSSFTQDQDMASLLAEHNIPSLMLQVMHAREDDDDMIIQVLYSFVHMLTLTPTRRLILGPLNTTDTATKHEHLVDHLIALIYDRNPFIRSACVTCLEIIQTLAFDTSIPDSDNVQEYARHISSERFLVHNAEWIQALSQSANHIRTISKIGLLERNKKELHAGHNRVLDHDDGEHHHAADIFGHTKLVYA